VKVVDMKTRNLVIILLTILSANQSLAQEFRILTKDVYYGDFEIISTKLNYSDIAGSPYLNKDLVLGQVIFKSGDTTAYYLRYDMYRDDMEYLINKSLYSVVNIPALDHIDLNGQRIVYKTYYDNNRLSKGYLIQLVIDQCSLYQKLQVKFEDAQPMQSMPFREATPAQFKSTPVKWYFTADDLTIKQFKPDNAGLKQVSVKHYAKLKAYIKANRLKIKKEDDLVTLFKYYNELLIQ
jgi:hypothetical protein